MLVQDFFFNDPATTETYTLSLRDALPISGLEQRLRKLAHGAAPALALEPQARDGAHLRDGDADGDGEPHPAQHRQDRKSTRLNSSHANISYAVFCLKKKLHLTHEHISHAP